MGRPVLRPGPRGLGSAFGNGRARPLLLLLLENLRVYLFRIQAQLAPVLSHQMSFQNGGDAFAASSSASIYRSGRSRLGPKTDIAAVYPAEPNGPRHTSVLA
jgi:hypothetical protein